jgi:hypothetical protein
MPRPKGPEKGQVKLWLLQSTIEWLERKAGDRAVPTYLAETIEQQAANAAKSRPVEPNFKKGGKK